MTERHGYPHERSMYCHCGAWVSDMDGHRAEVAMALVRPEVDRQGETISSLEQQLAASREEASSLGREVNRWVALAAGHQHWGQRRWNAWKSARARAQRAQTELTRLRAGEEPGWDPLVVPTPGQWIARFNRASAEERLDVAKRVIGYTARAGECFEMNHARRLEEDREAQVAMARVRDVIAVMEKYTGTRHYALLLHAALGGQVPESGAVAGQPLTETQAAAVRDADLPRGARITREVIDEAVRQHVAEAHPTEEQAVPNPKRITIDAPNGATVLAARHLDATEGPVQVGSTVDTATRSAITVVLRYIAKAHNSPAAPAEFRESTP